MTDYRRLTPTFQRYVDDMLPQIIDQSAMQGVLFDDDYESLRDGFSRFVLTFCHNAPAEQPAITAVSAVVEDATTAFDEATHRPMVAATPAPKR